MQATIVFQKHWKAIHETNDDGSRRYRYIIHEGSSRSSKTISIIQAHDLYARSEIGKRITVWRDTKTDCKKTVLVDMLKTLKRQGGYKVGQDFNKTESIFTYFTDSTVEIHGTDDEETVHGLTQDVAHLNEPYKISRDTFDQIDQRTSDFVIIDYNPKKDHWVEDLKKDQRALVIHSTFKDNPFCPPEQRYKILSYQPVSLSEAVTSGMVSVDIAKKEPLSTFENLLTEKQLKEVVRCRENEDKNTANIFKWQVYGLGLKSEKPNRIFNWTEIPIGKYNEIQKPIFIGCDWGKVDPWGILEVKYDDGRLYLHELNYDSENQWRERIKDIERSNIDREGEDGIVTWLFERLGISKSVEIICDSNRPLKIAALRRIGYNANPATKGSGSVIDGIDLLQDLDVYYTSESPNIKYEQEVYSYKVDRYGVIVDEPDDLDNHLIDPTRYVVSRLRQLGIIRTV